MDLGLYLTLLSTVNPPLPHGVRAHSAKAQAMSVASLQEIPLLDICKAAT